MKSRLHRIVLFTPGLIGLWLLAMSIIVVSSTAGSVSAQSPPLCKVAIALDRSASIGDNWGTYRSQVLNLFEDAGLGGGLGGNNIELAFWTFSNVSNPVGVNYNAPLHEYVPTGALGKAVFESAIPVDADSLLGGQTNYEQGFGYNAGNPNNMDGMNTIRSQANVIAFLTDGAPNYPGGLDSNPQAVAAGNSARNRYAPSVPVIGGFVSPDPNSTYVPLALYQTINGNTDTSASNIGPLGFATLTDYLVPKILDACNVQVQPASYSIIPVVNVDTSSAKSGDQIHFSYSGNNTTSDGSSGNTNWSIFDITIAPSFLGAPPCTGGNSYCDGVIDCNQIRALIANQGTCDPVPLGGRGACGATPSTDPGRGNRTFTPGPNAFYNPPRCQTVDNLPLGTRVCSILKLDNPASSGPDNRISGAACVVIGKTPLVQIHGGDLRVGRHFKDDSTPADDSGVYTSRFKITDDAALIPNGRTYGSWVEYGVLAPGPIQKIASLSGYSGPNVPNGGTDNSITATSDCDVNNNNTINKLTFANTVADPLHATECGYLSENPGLIPDVVSALTASSATRPIAGGTPLILDGNSPGLYANAANGNFEVGTDASATILPKGQGKTFVIYVPNGTVTIAGDMQYADDTYTNSNEIPQLVIIAKNIKIKEKVVRVDAWLVAYSTDNSGGSIDTCTGYTPPLSSRVCEKQLRINGPVMARDLNLWRTKVDLSDPACKVTGALSDCNTVGDPAEIINLPGSSILWAEGYGSTAARAQTTYTTELPPYF